jgi:glucokinase
VKRILALDIGGTKLAAAIVGVDGTLAAETRRATPRTNDPEALFNAVVALARESLERTDEGSSDGDVVAVGVGCGGPMRSPDGIVSPLHISAWRDFPLRDRVRNALGLPCVVDNDAKAFAFGEHWLGAGRGARALLGVIVATGVGGGIVVDGRLVHGTSGQAGHVGHVVADTTESAPLCACGSTGCVEAIASGSALARRGGTDAKQLAERARSGDSEARRLFTDAGRALARGIGSAAALLDLDRVVIGGGVALGAWDLLEPDLRGELRQRTKLSFTRDLKVSRSTLGDRACLAGAAKLAFEP